MRSLLPKKPTFFLTNAILEDLADTRQELLASRAIIKLLKSVFETMGFKLRWKHQGLSERQSAEPAYF